MGYKITEIEGIGPAKAEMLAKANISTTDQLLELCCDAKGRKSASETTGCSESQLLKWANMADLMRISGVGEEFSELLEAAGVDTVKELRNRNAENLAAKMAEVNAEKKLTRSVPAAKTVAKWVEQAKELKPLITH
jgi:predicted flap endonuclease-1-like 5' DNA nuclease